MTTIVVGIVGVLAYIYFGLKARRTRERHGYDAEPFALFTVKTLVISALILFLVYQFATYRGLPIVLVVMGLLIGALRLRHQAHDDRPPHLRHGRQRQGRAAFGHQHRTADASSCSSTWACCRRSAG